jgi:PAS domain S-box-containing protein
VRRATAAGDPAAGLRALNLLPPVLLVDESPDDRELIGLVLAGAFGGVEIEEAGDATALARAVSAGRFGVVLTEHELSWIKSKDVLRLIRDLRPDCPIVLVTGAPVERVAAEILHLAPDGLVPKTSAGLAGLPRVLRAALFQTRRRRAAESGDVPHRRLLDALPVGVFVASAEGTLLDANPALAAALGFAAPEDVAQRHLDALFAVRAEGEALRATLAAGAPPTTVEARLRRADGTSFWARVTAWRAEAPDGAGPISGLLEDRGAARAAEEELGRRSDALARSSAELDEMAYVVSHDLRKPLGQVVRFLDLLDQDAGERLGREAHGLLEQARASAARLESMVEAVLRCARIDSQGGEFVPVDLDAVLGRVLERASGEISALGGGVTRERLPTVSADEAQIEQLFTNLVDNAVKFRGDAAPRLTIDALDEAGTWHLRFRDHGVGIDAGDAERIFAMFQRLHTQAEVPGSGIGLALCRRIVARHGGRIWVESERGAGATFHVTLPKRAAAPAAGAGGGQR